MLAVWRWLFALLPTLLLAALVGDSARADGVQVTGELRCWHKLTFSFAGPTAEETDTTPNPFVDYAVWIEFTHHETGRQVIVPGYFAADGNAGETAATSGNIWRAHLTAGAPGEWRYRVHFLRGEGVALLPEIPPASDAFQPVGGVDGLAGDFVIKSTNKTGRDFRARGRLRYVGERYLRFAETGRPFIKAGPDAPETLLAYEDFDGTTSRNKNAPLKSWAPHLRDWRPGDPTWRHGKGRGLVGAINYLAATGVNSMSFLPYNAGGDGDNVWPMVSPEEPRHYDCSKLDQWQTVFDHAQQRGIFLHFKLQETENDDRVRDDAQGVRTVQNVPYALDDGELGPERKLYYRELVARFGYALALNWNLGEENTQTTEQHAAMAQYLRSIDPYDHLIVMHTYPWEQEKVYRPLVGRPEVLTGASLQNLWNKAHRQTKKWVTESHEAEHPWVCCNDEQGPAQFGVPCDPDFEPSPHRPATGAADYDYNDIRKQTLWGTLLAGGAGVEYYFGYQLAENDLQCENWRSRERAWQDCRRAIDFFEQHPLPLAQMLPRDELVEPKSPGRAFCLAKPGAVYLVYLLEGGAAELNLTAASGEFRVAWYNPRVGGKLLPGDATLRGGGQQQFTAPTAGEDWLAIVRRPSD